MKAILKKPILLSLLLCALVLGFFAAYLYFYPDVGVLKNNYPVLVTKERKPIYTFQARSPSYWAELKDISPNLKGAIILSEDWSFYQHDGVDYVQIHEVLAGLRTTAKVRGASTITQQLVKNVFLSPEKTLWRKLREMMLSRRLERLISKDRILEIYLNSIEYGPGIYGIRRAARHYFKKTPKHLSPRESAFIAMLLPSPIRYYVSFKQKSLTPFAEQRVQQILTKMRMGKVITPAQYEAELGRRFIWEASDQMP